MGSKLCITSYDFHSFFALPKASNSVAKISIVQSEIFSSEVIEEWLSNNELEQYHSFGSEKRKQQYAMGRIAAKNAIMQLNGSKYPKEIEIANAEDGYPIVGNAKISITHSDNCAAAIASFSTVFGIDMESVKEQKIKALSYISLEKEPIEHTLEQLTIAWCMKESLSKALLCGFKLPFESFRIKKFLKPAENNTIYYAEYEHYPQYKSFASDFQMGNTSTIISVTYPDDVVNSVV